MNTELNDSHIDVKRLFNELGVTPVDIERVSRLNISQDVGVTSMSLIKTNTVRDVLHLLRPGEVFNVFGFKAASGVAEQPLGQVAVKGALNRLDDAMRQYAPAPDAKGISWFSVENGLFRSSGSEHPDLSSEFDPSAEYEDRAVTAVHIPRHPTVIETSPLSEAVHFPKEAVLGAYYLDGSFAQHTAGSQLVEMGIVKDGQNPHIELTTERVGGPLSRQDQMARVIVRALVRVSRQASF